MSRSGYSDDCENVQLWRQAVDNAAFGKRGQVFLKRLRAALDAMPIKRLIAEQLVDVQGQVCALGAVDPAVSAFDPYDRDAIGAYFNIAPALAAEIAFVNDGEFAWHRNETPEERWSRMRAWVDKQIEPEE